MKTLNYRETKPAIHSVPTQPVEQNLPLQEIMITFVISTDQPHYHNTFQLDEDSLDYHALKNHYQENPPFKSICNLVEYHGRNGIKLDEDIANINWECDYEDEYDVSGREEGPYSDEVYGILDHLVEESKMKYSSITFSVPILKKYK